MALKYKTNFTEASRRAGGGASKMGGFVGGRAIRRTLCMKGWGGQKESSRGCFE